MVGNSRHWSEFIASLRRRRVKFIIIGAHALAVLGCPRQTGDLDVLVQPSPQNAARLAQAFRDFDFDEAADKAGAFAGPAPAMMMLGVSPVRIDVTNSISGVSFPEAWKGRKKHRIGKKRIPFLGRREFVKNKRASAKRPSRRGKDLADLAMLGEKEEND